MTLGKFNFILSVSLIYYFVSCINCHYSEQGRLYLKLHNFILLFYKYRLKCYLNNFRKCGHNKKTFRQH